MTRVAVVVATLLLVLIVAFEPAAELFPFGVALWLLLLALHGAALRRWTVVDACAALGATPCVVWLGGLPGLLGAALGLAPFWLCWCVDRRGHRIVGALLCAAGGATLGAHLALLYPISFIDEQRGVRHAFSHLVILDTRQRRRWVLRVDRVGWFGAERDMARPRGIRGVQIETTTLYPKGADLWAHRGAPPTHPHSPAREEPADGDWPRATWLSLDHLRLAAMDDALPGRQWPSGLTGRPAATGIDVYDALAVIELVDGVEYPPTIAVGLRGDWHRDMGTLWFEERRAALAASAFALLIGWALAIVGRRRAERSDDPDDDHTS